MDLLSDIRDTEDSRFNTAEKVHRGVAKYVAIEPVQDHQPLSGGKSKTDIDSLYCQNLQNYIPATSVPSEQATSLAGYIVNQRRACLLPANVNMLS